MRTGTLLHDHGNIVRIYTLLISPLVVELGLQKFVILSLVHYILKMAIHVSAERCQKYRLYRKLLQ